MRWIGPRLVFLLLGSLLVLWIFPTSVSRVPVVMGWTRNLLGEGASRQRDEEGGVACSTDEDSPTNKKPARIDGRFPLTRWELAAASSVFILFSMGLFSIYLTLPEEEYGMFRLPRSISDIRVLK